MKRHIQDFNRFSVNEAEVGPVDGIKTYGFDMNIVHHNRRGTMGYDGPTREMTYEFMYALQKNNVLLNVLEWFGPGGGTTVIELTGTEDAIKQAFRDSMDSETAGMFIEEMDEYGPVR